MVGFRSDDYVSLEFVIFVLFAVTVLLSATYFFLKLYKNRMFKINNMKIKGAIRLMESKYIPNLGYLFLISVDDTRFFVLSTKFGVNLFQIDSSSIFSKMEASKMSD